MKNYGKWYLKPEDFKRMLEAGGKKNSGNNQSSKRDGCIEEDLSNLE